MLATTQQFHLQKGNANAFRERVHENDIIFVLRPLLIIRVIEIYVIVTDWPYFSHVFNLWQKKLSIPTTVSRVVKYIPELQQQVETLTLKKKQLLSTLPHIPKPEDVQTPAEHRNITKIDRNQRGGLVAPNTSSITNFSSSSSSSSSSSTVSTSWVSDDEIMVQVSFDATNNMVHVSDLLFHLEEECGLVVLNTSSFCSPQGMAFYNLHFQVCIYKDQSV
ncbi:Transcription factor ORG2 [Linum grandiflorum]